MDRTLSSHHFDQPLSVRELRHSLNRPRPASWLTGKQRKRAPPHDARSTVPHKLKVRRVAPILRLLQRPNSATGSREYNERTQYNSTSRTELHGSGDRARVLGGRVLARMVGDERVWPVQI